MSRFSPLTGVVASITPIQTGSTTSYCTLMIYLQNNFQETYQIILDANTFVLGQKLIRRGDTVTAFYDTTAPMPLIYPPQYHAVAVVSLDTNQYAALDYFDQELVNSDNTLKLNISCATNLMLPNGQYYMGMPGNQYLLVIYSTHTRSIPAQTTPSHVTVFCSTEQPSA